jgi:hypothetical protein
MPLECFAREGQLLDVRCFAWLDVTRWFVPWSKTRDAREGRDHRGRAWTAMELLGVPATAGTTTEALQMIALAKLTIDAAEIRETEIRESRRRLPCGQELPWDVEGGEAPVKTSGMPTRVA